MGKQMASWLAATTLPGFSRSNKGGQATSSSLVVSDRPRSGLCWLLPLDRCFLWQPCRCLAHIELAGDHVGDKAGTVFAEEFDLAFEAGDGVFKWAEYRVEQY